MSENRNIQPITHTKQSNGIINNYCASEIFQSAPQVLATLSNRAQSRFACLFVTIY